MIVDFVLIMLAIAIGAFGGIYLGMRLQVAQRDNPTKTDEIAQQEDVELHADIQPESASAPDIQEQRLHADEEMVVRNAEAVLTDASENATKGKELRKKMRNQDARYCVLKKD